MGMGWNQEGRGPQGERECGLSPKRVTFPGPLCVYQEPLWVDARRLGVEPALTFGVPVWGTPLHSQRPPPLLGLFTKCI